jgi:predicted phosphoribosyltransferase
MNPRKSRRFFINRVLAAEMMAAHLSVYKGFKPLILVLSRSALEMGQIVAENLNGRLALTPALLSNHFSASFSARLSAPWPDNLANPMLAKLAPEPVYVTGYPAQVDGAVVVLLNDGIGGAGDEAETTMMATLRGLHRQHPAELICALPVAEAQALERIRPLTDTLACLHVSDIAGSVDRFYDNNAVADEDDVARILARAAAFARPAKLHAAMALSSAGEARMAMPPGGDDLTSPMQRAANPAPHLYH